MAARRAIAIRFAPDELAVLETRAQERGCDRSELIRRLVVEGRPQPKAGELSEADLVALLEERARNGNVRAIELLLRRVKQPEQTAAPFDEFDELASRRAS